jgi:hypothetical protein
VNRKQRRAAKWHVRLTAAGLRGLEEGAITDPRHVLVIEILKRTGTISREHLTDLCQEVVRHCRTTTRLPIFFSARVRRLREYPRYMHLHVNSRD